MNGDTRSCPHCGGEIKAAAQLCKHCHRSIGATDPPAAAPAPDAVPHATPASSSGRFSEFVHDLRAVDFRNEVVPIDRTNLSALAKDFFFWAVGLLGVVPLFVASVFEDRDLRLMGFALFFAAIWGVVLKVYVLKHRGQWGIAIGSLFATGIVGVFTLLTAYQLVVPDDYLRLSQSENAIVSLLGFVFQVGLWEETWKALPVAAFMLWKRRQLGDANVAMTIVCVGVFSGLGFSAFENIGYGKEAVVRAYLLTSHLGAGGLFRGVQDAMMLAMLRSVSLVFCHAVWSGIVAYFLATAFVTRRRLAALAVVGVGVAAGLHGVYDWLSAQAPLLAAFAAGFSFMLFYAYVSSFQRLLSMRTASACQADVGPH